jgi:lipoprotein-anchoring transpeptidase ErfK/SrfK
MNRQYDPARHALQQAHRALKEGDRRTARRWAEKAASLAPEREENWLTLAALASPKASIAYLKRALEINPGSLRARQGMRWAVNRFRHSPKPKKPQRQIVSPGITPKSMTQPRPALLPWAIAVLVMMAGLLIWFGTPDFTLASNPQAALSLVMNAEKATYTSTPTATFTPTPTLTPTPTPTNTPTPTDTPTPTQTFTPTNTPSPEPTSTPEPTRAPEKISPETDVKLPPGVNRGDNWIDIDLTNQRLYAYKGKNLLNGFVISSGTWQHPTLTGQYKIYVKYRYADMSGPGYYLPNVPYVMYFYKGYGIHGTYWHNNFGTPMSHGCVNLITEDAGWVYNWADIGTLVNIHY